MKKYIVREIPAEDCDFSFYFDDDGLTSAGGDYCYNLFIISREWGRVSGFNTEEYNRIVKQADYIIDGFSDVKSGERDYNGKRITYKDIMIDNDIPYNSRKCHALKTWAESADTYKPESIAEFLTITTGKTWAVSSARGYCQGDYVEMVYCPEHYKNGVENYGEIWLGAGKEFCTIELDENGEEVDSCFGYIVADCEAWRDEDYKRIVCEWAGIPEEETTLEMIDDYTITRNYKYRVA